MSDEMISQEEIDALLKGDGDTPPADAGAASAPAAEDPLSDMQKDALGEIGNISMGSAATTLSVLLGHKVSITTPSVSMSTMNSIRASYPMPYLIVEVGYTIGINGNNVLAIQAQDASIIADLMMGGDGTNPPEELNDIHMSAVGEAMNQMMGAVSTSLSTMFNKKIDISPPKVSLIDFGTEEKVTEIVSDDEPVVKVSFRMEVDGLIDSEIMQILPVSIAGDMVEGLLHSGDAEEEPEPEAPPVPAPAAPAPAAPAPAAASAAAAAGPIMAPAASYGMGGARVAQGVPVQTAQFTLLRSEERRVGKECRSRWSPYH